MTDRENRLGREKSPYLLQHARNPVDWYPWGEEAFRRAKEEEKPVFLSIGYSTCHWCHVMARESFEDTEVASYLNDNFVCVKVDREERPDVDHVYMTVCQMLAGSGGWPLTIVMTPDKKPFWAGTYLPRRRRFGLPGLIDVLEVLAQAWSEDRETLLEQAEKVTIALRANMDSGSFEPAHLETGEDPEVLDIVLDRAYERFREAFDEEYGGFGGSPKFLSSHNLLFLLRYWRRTGDRKAFEMVDETLKGAYSGGIYDHIGFGFFRYSTDDKWIVPHFEKMLYDNAMLMLVFTDMAEATQKACHREIVWEIASFLDREMKSPENAFYTAIDAESEGVEGKFYVWTPAEVTDALGSPDKEFMQRYGITEKGNFNGSSIPNLAYSRERDDVESAMPPRKGAIEKNRKKLLEARERRTKPGVDDKILTSWNALAVAAFAKAARAFGDPDYLDMARDCLNFLTETLVKDGVLYARYRDKDVSYRAYLDDYAYLIWALIEMHQTTLDREYLDRAERLCREMVREFWDEGGKGFFLTSGGAEELIVRPKDTYDGAVPSGNSVAVMDLLRLSHLLEDGEFAELAEEAIRAMLPSLRKNPMAHAHLLSALDYYAGGAQDIRIKGSLRDATVQAMVEYVRRVYLPNAQILLEESDSDPDRPVLTICQRQTCGAPIRTVDDLQIALMGAINAQSRAR